MADVGMNLFDVVGKTALITGGGSGLESCDRRRCPCGTQRPKTGAGLDGRDRQAGAAFAGCGSPRVRKATLARQSGFVSLFLNRPAFASLSNVALNRVFNIAAIYTQL